MEFVCVTRKGRSIVVLVALVAASIAWASPALGGGGGTLVVTPNAGLVDFQRVELTGTGLEPGLQEWYQCRGGAVDESDCDGYNADFIAVAGDGTTSEVVYVDARIYLPDGTEVDCRTDPAGCEIGVGFMAEAGQWPTVQLDFDPAADLRPPVSGSVSPSTGLRDDQSITVSGQHLSFREEAFAYLCRAGDEPVGARCDIDRLARTVPDADGTATMDLKVRAAFDPPLGGSVDCRTPSTPCFVVVGWSFDPPPDRQAQSPVAFAAAPPMPTTTSPSTTTTAPPPPGRPPAATPVPAMPAFTG